MTAPPVLSPLLTPETLAKAMKLLEALAEPCNIPPNAPHGDHAWRLCRRCMAIRQFDSAPDVTRLLVQSIQAALAELDAQRTRLAKAEQENERLKAENEAFRSYRADTVSWADMLRGLRDRMQKGAENIDAALVAIEYDPAPDCPNCGSLLGGSFPTCASCQLVEALKDGK